MSLLLDARKKAQQAQADEAGHAIPADGQQPMIDDARQHAREAGQNLFNVKSSPSAHTFRPHILYALGATILMLGIGAGYWWYLALPAPAVPLQRQVATALQSPQQPPIAEHGNLSDEKLPAREVAPESAPQSASVEDSRESELFPPPKPAVRIEPQRTANIDPQLRDAYSAYRNGKPEEAQLLYQATLARDKRSTDALLGLAAIAQKRGNNMEAAQYFSRVLELDPRNPVANAGMSALNNEDNGNESRLKTLLREQDDSAALHFALGNLFAQQSRWSEAQQAYFNACTLEPDNAEFSYNLAVSLDHLGQIELAGRYYRRAQQLDGSHSAGFDHAQIARRIEELDSQRR